MIRDAIARPRLLSDEPALPGLLFAMRFDAAGRGEPVTAPEELADPGGFGQGFLWLHLNLNDARLADLVAAGRFGPPALAASAFAADPHQRVAAADGAIGGVVADLRHEGEAGGAADAGGRLHFVMGPRLVVSGRHHPIVGPDRTREEAEQGRPFRAPVRLLETLVGEVAAAMAAHGTRLSDALDAIEDHVLDGRSGNEGRRLGPIRRDAVRLHRQLLGLRAVFHRLEHEGAGHGVAADEIATAARIAQRLDAIDRDMTAIADRCRLLQEEVAAELARRSNAQLFNLSVLTALFLPPTLVTGLFGMNTKGLPFSDFENGSAMAIAIGLASAAVTYVVIRRVGGREAGRA